VAGVIWLASETRRTIHPAGSLWGTDLHQLELLHGRAGPGTRARPILVRVRQLHGKERDMRVSALQRREAGIELSRIAEVYKQFRSDLSDKEALKLAMLGNPDLAEPYLGCPVRWDAVDEVREFITNAY